MAIYRIDDEIREAIEIIKTRKPCEARFKAEGILIALAEEYLNIKGWPEERKPTNFQGKDYSNPTDEEFNSTLRLCKLAAMKEKSKVGIKCPFCDEDDFDLIGLKHHLLNYCIKIIDIKTIKEA